MNTHKISSAFSGETVIFHYPAERKTGRAVLILKGLYGEHIPENIREKQSWDNHLVDLLKDTYEVLIFNSGRRNTNDRREAFAGKTFQNECDDVRQAFIFCKKNILKREFSWGTVAMSFGGTTLLGCPNVLRAMQNVVMIGSGCGKSPTTAKPLISTLPDTLKLIETISGFEGTLYFLHGGKDTVVPTESQKKIFENATSCFSRGWIEFPKLDHELNDSETGKSHTATLVEKFLGSVPLK